VAYKLRHECERCGLAAEFERAGRFRDQDFYELLHEYFALEQEFARQANKLSAARTRIEQLRELVNMLPDPVPEVEFTADDDEYPFPG
jgi:hypothetical protein